MVQPARQTSLRVVTERSMGLEGMSKIHASRSRRFNCLLPAFISCRLLIRKDGGYFCGDVFFVLLLFLFLRLMARISVVLKNS